MDDSAVNFPLSGSRSFWPRRRCSVKRVGYHLGRLLRKSLLREKVLGKPALANWDRIMLRQFASSLLKLLKNRAT